MYKEELVLNKLQGWYAKKTTTKKTNKKQKKKPNQTKSYIFNIYV